MSLEKEYDGVPKTEIKSAGKIPLEPLFNLILQTEQKIDLIM